MSGWVGGETIREGVGTGLNLRRRSFRDSVPVFGGDCEEVFG
jgi:hypothetical protein